MNDESSVFENTEATPCQTCDTFETEVKRSRETCDDASENETSPGSDEVTVGVPADTVANSDSDCEGSDSQTQTSELEQLRGELTKLREELALRDARAHQEERITREYAEFCDLYPDIPISSLPQELWQDVQAGISLAAAYALAERKKAISLGRATQSNATNRARSAGSVNHAESNEFSPAEVRAMSSEEVRANLPKIMRSMQKWH